MHYGTALAIKSEGDWVKKRIAEEVWSSPQRYVVADLSRMTHTMRRAYAPGPDPHGPHALPRWFPKSERDKFPWNQKLVFRSGRYVVYEVVRDLGEIDIPRWEDVESLGPGE